MYKPLLAYYISTLHKGQHFPLPFLFLPLSTTTSFLFKFPLLSLHSPPPPSFYKINKALSFFHYSSSSSSSSSPFFFTTFLPLVHHKNRFFLIKKITSFHLGTCYSTSIPTLHCQFSFQSLQKSDFFDENITFFSIGHLVILAQFPESSPILHPPSISPSGSSERSLFFSSPMEKEAFFGGGGDHQLPNCFLNLNWDQSADHAAAQFESALSSLVSSPSSNAPPPGAGATADSVVIRELIGRLGSICNSGEISPPSQFQSTTTSCYSTPLNSPPKLNLMPPGGGAAGNPMAFAAANPGFAERAARFSCFGGGGARSYGQLGGLSRVSSSQSMKNVLPAMDGAQLDQNERRSGGAESGNGQEEPSIASDRGKASGTGESGGGRKRKAAATAPKGKGKEAPLTPMEEDSSGGAKRCKSGEAEEKEDNAKPVEPPKLDYIHVRARRGQATDSHSLAERVRREKISERMKFLQDLVPGCNKVTGKAVMLDEIINYVQSLQRQVEFLSMKLSTVNPRLEFNVDGLVQKDVQMHQPRGPVAAAPPHPVFPMEGASAAGFPYGNQPQMLPLQSLMASGMEGQGSLDAATLRRSLGMQLPNMDSFMDASSQLGAFWEDDLQSVVQMGFGQNQENVFSSSQAFQGSAPSNHMKIEL